MTNCKNCSGPLPPNTNICKYCGTRNDMDLKIIHKHTQESPDSNRICPRCDITLFTIDLKIKGRFLIEKCEKCYGLFFDPGELEALLDNSVSNVFNINHKQLENLGKEIRHDNYKVMYIKCPVCRKLMNRVNFGTRSGVIVDKCKEHGVWLDGGELKHLMEWVKAGGQLLHHQAHMEQERLDIQKEKQKWKNKTAPGSGLGAQEYHGMGGAFTGRGFHEEQDLFSLLTRFVSKVLK